MNGRIETYIHSDSITQNKGGAMVKVTCDTDFAAKVAKFKDFCVTVAKYSYAANSTVWDEVIALFPDLEDVRKVLEKEFREKIVVSDIVILKL
jgi:translation elongation factor EF-Ts